MFAQVDGDRNINFLFEEIVYHQNDGSEFKQKYAFITTQNG